MGVGKLGLPVALACESKGHDVVVYDINPKVQDIIATRKLPYMERGADELLKTTKIKVVDIPELVAHSDLIFVPIQTPHEARFEGVVPLPRERADFDYSFLVRGLTTLTKEIDRQGNIKIVIIISTVLPGTIEREIKPILSKNVRLCYNPFFIAMSTTIDDFLNPEFVLFGVDDKEAAEKAKEFYRTVHNKPFFETSIKNAEAIKVFYNTFISTKIGFANTIMEICHKMGCDCDEVYRALSLATDRIISPKYMMGGMADSGACHPRDNIALSFVAKKYNLSNDWFEEIMLAREEQTAWLADLIQEYKGNREIIILGTAYKPEVNLEVGSSAILLKNILQSRGERVKTYDPYINVTDDKPPLNTPALFFIGTKHKEFIGYDFPGGSVVIDPFRYIPTKNGIRVIGIGKPRQKHILVTGGAGYIGSKLVERLLLERKYRVTVVDNLTFGQDGRDVLQLDVRNFDYNLLNDVDVVVNLAALNLPLSKKYPEEAEEINHIAAVKLAKECEKRAIKFIFSSTCSNYGIKSDGLAVESDELYPTTLYTKTKVEAEKELSELNNTVILRFATAYGLGKRQFRTDILLHDFILSAYKHKKITLMGAGFYRPLCNIDDISSAIILAIEKQFKGSVTYNIGNTEHNYTKMDLANIVKDVIDCEIIVDDSIPDPRNYRVSFEKAKTELGFITKHSPKESIREIVEALESNKLDVQNLIIASAENAIRNTSI